MTLIRQEIAPDLDGAAARRRAARAAAEARPGAKAVPEIRPSATARLFGLPRSGNHAIAAWLCRNMDGDVLLLNNCRPGGPPAGTAWQVEWRGETLGPSAARADEVAAFFARVGPAPSVLITYEETLPGLPGADPSEASFEAAIWRSYTNWLASLLALYRRQAPRRGLSPAETLDRVLLEMRLYRAGLAARGACDVIEYDQWATSEAYRGAALERLGLPRKDLSLGPQATYGGGSSFGAKGSTARRWQAMAGDRDYRYLIGLSAADEPLMAALGQHQPEEAERVTRLAKPGWQGTLMRWLG